MFKTFRRLCSTTPKGWTLESSLKESTTVSIRSLKDQTKLQFPLVWLRDNCQCPKCFSKASKSRTLDLRANLKVKPLHVQLDKMFKDNAQHPASDAERAEDKSAAVVRSEADGYKLNIQWEDGHKSHFTLDWLLSRSFTDENRRKLSEVYKMSQIPWTAAEFETSCSRFQFDDIVENDRSLLKWLEWLAIYGVAIVEKAGTQVGSLKEFAKRVGFLKRTQYGETFLVQAKEGATNQAYLNSKLQLHTDLPYYEHKPGLNMLHCIVQSPAASDGKNQLVDCLAVCRYLSTNERRVFDVLTKTNVNWSDYGEDDRFKFESIHCAPVICVDTTGRVTRVNYNQPQRDSVFNVPLAEVEPWYDAMARFTELLHDPKYMVELKINPGEVLTFDNIRLVHGRSGYDGERLLEGGYLDWDLVRSRIRVLREESNKRVDSS